jgi:hypothetical protein
MLFSYNMWGMSTINLFLELLYTTGATHGTEDGDFLDAHVLTPSYVCELVLSFDKEPHWWCNG